MVTSTSTYNAYSNGGPVGIQPNQSMFITDSTRAGMFAARSSCVNMLNYIFSQSPIASDRPEAVAALSVETPIDQYVAWRRPIGTTHIEVIPPSTEWDYQVYTLEDRDRLVLDKSVLFGVSRGNPIRVLVNGLGNPDQPQWSLWIGSITNAPSDATTGSIHNNPSSVYALAKAYQYHVASFVDRDNLITSSPPIIIGQRVLVDGNSSTDGFWTLWEYVGPISGDPDVDASGFKLMRYQTYRTADFWNYVDYYASGYSVTDPPIVVYSTTASRDAAETPPKSSIVKILNDGTGAWIWTAYINGEWQMVARQNGTIAFSTSLYDNPAAPVIGISPIQTSDLNNISTRDGSWEFRVLFDLLQDANLLMPIEVNQLFFSMLHFIHAQQDQVPWAFKTSFMNIGGYNQSLTQTPVTPIDNITNLTEYITEIAPYRVKIRNFTEIVTPSIDYANTSVSDFDFPLYFDSVSNVYRILDINSANDLEIIQTTKPWSDWYSMYQKPYSEAANYVASTWNAIRHFRITMLFDRCDIAPVITTQYFTFNSNSGDYDGAPLDAVPFDSLTLNPRQFDIDFTNTQITDLTEQLVEVYDNDVLIPTAQVIVGTTYVQILNSPSNGDNIKVVVRAGYTPGYAADRINQFYNPTGTNDPEGTVQSLMGLDQKSNTNDGGSFDNNDADYAISGNYTGAASDETINPNSSYFGFADPSHDANRPEELVAIGSGESLTFLSYDSNNASVVTLISTSRPTTDLMTAEFAGDYGMTFDSIPFDQGFAPEYGIDNSSVRHGLYVFRSDAWQTTTWSNVGGTLQFDLHHDSNAVYISTSGGMPFTIPVVENVANTTSTHLVTTTPGVVWVNGERIEFFNYTTVGNTATLSQIRRGTHGTRIGAEQRIQSHYVGDGSIYNFYLANASIANVAVYVNTGNATTMLQLNRDYTIIQQTSGNAEVLFNTIPAANTDVFIAETTGLHHPTGTSVYDGSWTYYSPA